MDHAEQEGEAAQWVMEGRREGIGALTRTKEGMGQGQGQQADHAGQVGGAVAA